MKKIYSVLLCFAGVSLSAQTLSSRVIANAGEKISSSSYSISFTLGESITNTITNSVSIHQGFWATVEADRLLSTNDFAQNYPSVSYFPNPVSDELTIAVSEAREYEILVFSMTGQLLLQHQEAKPKTSHTLNIKSFPRGIYLVQLRIPKTQATNTFKINKL